MKLLGVDFESFSDDAKTTPITEVAAILMEETVIANDFQELERMNHLVYHEGYPPLDPFISELTNITDEMLKAEGVLPRRAMEDLNVLVGQADYCVAHNKLFDETVFKSLCGRLNITPFPTPWLCTWADIEYPRKFTCKKLTHLAWEHGYPVDRTKAHRGIYDVELMLGFVSANYKWADIIAFSQMPWIVVKAEIPPPWIDGGAGKQLAAKRGYAYETPRGSEDKFPKSWVKRLKEHQLEAEIKEAPFKVVILKGRSNEDISGSKSEAPARADLGDTGAGGSSPPRNEASGGSVGAAVSSGGGPGETCDSR